MLFCGGSGNAGSLSTCMRCCRFLEHGEYKEHLYGTSLGAVRAVLARNKVCVVDVEPEVSACPAQDVAVALRKF